MTLRLPRRTPRVFLSLYIGISTILCLELHLLIELAQQLSNCITKSKHLRIRVVLAAFLKKNNPPNRRLPTSYQLVSHYEIIHKFDIGQASTLSVQGALWDIPLEKTIHSCFGFLELHSSGSSLEGTCDCHLQVNLKKQTASFVWTHE
jgi:hypothetical protein